MCRVVPVVLVCAAACGRIGFDRAAGTDGGSGTLPDDATPGDSGSDGGGTGTFGTMQVGISAQNSGVDRVWISRFTLAEPARVTALVVHMAPTGGQTPDVRGIIYADASGTPTTLLGTTTPTTLVVASPADWVRLSFTTPIALSPGTFWLGTHNAAQITLTYQSATGATRFANDTYADGTDATYAGGGTTFAMEISIYAEYVR